MATQLDRSLGRAIFGRDAAGYQSGRLDYPAELFDLLSVRCGLRPGCTLFEIGPGTGQATIDLLARGAKITAIEPDPALAEILRALPVSSPAGLNVVNDSFEKTSLPGGVYELGVAATSFGWLDAEKALPVVRAALRSGGWWAMWWNIFRDTEGDPVFDEAVAGLARPQAFRSGTHYSLDAPARIRELERAGFAEVEYVPVRRARTMTPQALRALYATFSPLRTLPPEESKRRLDRVEERAEAEASDGLISRTYLTTLYIARNP